MLTSPEKSSSNGERPRRGAPRSFLAAWGRLESDADLERAEVGVSACIAGRGQAEPGGLGDGVPDVDASRERSRWMRTRLMVSCRG